MVIRQRGTYHPLLLLASTPLPYSDSAPLPPVPPHLHPYPPSYLHPYLHPHLHPHLPPHPGRVSKQQQQQQQQKNMLRQVLFLQLYNNYILRCSQNQ